MKRMWIRMMLVSIILTLSGEASGQNWPGFRGPEARGIAEGFSTPTEWDVPQGTNVLWKKPIPGMAHSSPVIWGDRMFIATAIREGESELKVGLYGSGDSVEDEGNHQFKLYCLDVNTGDVIWERTAFEGMPRVKRHPKSSHANATPMTDGEFVVVFFASEGLYCYTIEGEKVWQRDLGVLNSTAPGSPDYQWGFASSPIIHEDRVIVQCDVQNQSFLTMLDLKTGEEIWRTDRDEDSTWGTPCIDVREGRSQIICNGYKRIGGYDLETGDALWWMHGGGDVPVPTPIIAFDLIFITSAHGRQKPIYAIKPDVEGEITDDPDDGFMVWSNLKNGNYMQTPIVYGDELYCCRDDGILSCFDAKTGTMHYRERLGGGGTGFSASAVAADGKVFITSEEGDVLVLKAGPTFEVIAINSMGETCMATPAISKGTMYYRTRHHVVAIGEMSQNGTNDEAPGQ
ncbi:MAG: PQQ-binding-like beta-propeller repeat protein [Planctomycetota bacterium]|nr:PQQ-binding-like beta-propeller repeat protein [Planctomycetota bacterium]